MRLDDCFYFSSRLRVGDYEVVPVFTNINRGFNDLAKFYDVSLSFLKNNYSVSESLALCDLSISELSLIYNYTYEIAEELGYRKLLISFPSGLIQIAADNNFFDELPTKDIYIKVDYFEFKEIILRNEQSFFEFGSVKVNIVLVINDLSNSDLYCNFLSQVFAIKLSSECFGFYYRNRKKFLSSYLNKMKDRIDLIVVDGVSHIDQLLFCRAKNVSVQGYFIDFLRRFS